jgi:lipid A disaccharide synthetase
VNLILDKPAVNELIQYDCNFNKLKEEVAKILYDTHIINEMKGNYKQLQDILGNAGVSDNVAKLIVKDDIR